MKYIMIVAVLFGSVDGEWTEMRKTEFQLEFDSAKACFDAMDVVDAEQSAKPEFRGLVIDCSPANDVSLRNAVL